MSRTIIDKVRTVTLFAFNKEKGFGEHVSPYDAIAYIPDGESKIVISNKIFNVGKGEMWIMPANKPHSLKTKIEFKMLLIMTQSLPFIIENIFFKP